MTREELKECFATGIRISCKNSAERNAVIALMLDMGYRHGSSGVSVECMRGGHEDEWLAPFVYEGVSIGFYQSGRTNDLLFDDIAHLIYGRNSATQVDDLL